jgi:hypothetical protein
VSFANQAVTIGRALTDNFVGIEPGPVAGFVGMQIVGAVVAPALVTRIFMPRRTTGEQPACWGIVVGGSSSGAHDDADLAHAPELTLPPGARLVSWPTASTEAPSSTRPLPAAARWTMAARTPALDRWSRTGFRAITPSSRSESSRRC